MLLHEERKPSTLMPEILTRMPIALGDMPHTPMPAWIYTALLGNGRILACLDETGEIVQFFYPHIDTGPHVRTWLTGLSVTSISAHPAEHKSQTFSWLADKAWTHTLHYREQTAVLHIVSRNDALQLQVERTVAVHPTMDVLMIEVSVSNLGAETRLCRLITAAGCDFDQRPTGNCCFFESETDTLTFFAANRYLRLLSTAPVAAFDCHNLAYTSVSTLFDETQLSGREYAIGQVKGEVSHSLGEIAPGASASLSLYHCFGRTLDEVSALAERVREQQPGCAESVSWWRARYASLELPACSEEVRRTYERSLIMLRLLTDSQTGGIIAGPECDPNFSLCGGYGMCWPRDGAYNAHALDVAGEHEQARLFYDWALRVQEPAGGWHQRYFVNGQLAPTWGLEQFDEIGAVVWAICRHIQLTGDLNYGRRVFAQLVRACEYMQCSLDRETGLAPISKELWEEQDLISTYACASTWGGFSQLAQLAASLDEPQEAERWQTAAAHLKQAIETELWDERLGHFPRGRKRLIHALPLEPEQVQRVEFAGRTRSAQHQDATIDISTLALSLPFEVFSPDDARMRAMAEAIAHHLTSPAGGIMRYQEDQYRGGNPWILCTLWLAWYDLQAGNLKRAREMYAWVLAHRTALDLLPEQVDRNSGEACWIIPLGWSHAMFILVTQALARQNLLP